jgi:hypothetical protein
VPFHVEISRGFRHHARAFNLDEARLRNTILEPWVQGRMIELGDREWQPKDCKLRILEGPELSDADLAMGRGWSNAERSSENVTRRLVEEATTPPERLVAVLGETAESEAELVRMVERLRLETVSWTELRARILSGGAGGRTGYSVVLAFESPVPSGSWLFDAGLARGALGAQAILAQLGNGGIPAELAGLEVMRLEPGDEASLQALGARLRAA